MNELVVKLLEFKTNESIQTSFLGKGRFGHVFRVQLGDRTHALKIIDNAVVFDNKLTLSDDELFKAQDLVSEEIKRIQFLKSKGISVVTVIENSFLNFNNFSCYLMEEVGESCHSQFDYKAILKFLNDLHLKNECHGDPRLKNVIKINKYYYWIDLRPSDLATSFSNDLSIMIESMNNIKFSKHSKLFQSLINNYNTSKDIEPILKELQLL